MQQTNAIKSCIETTSKNITYYLPGDLSLCKGPLKLHFNAKKCKLNKQETAK